MNSIINEHFTNIFFNHSQWTLANEVCWVMKKLSKSALKSSPKWLQKGTKRLRCMTRPGVSKLRPTGQMRPAIQLLLTRIKSEDTFVYHISLYILSIFLQTLKKVYDMTSPKHSITATIESNIFDFIYVGELEINTELTHHCPKYSVWPGPLPITVYMAHTAKALETTGLDYTIWY